MYMGRTSLTLDDIRQYNAAQGRRTYTLHENDCRYVFQASAAQQLHWDFKIYVLWVACR
jgi:hypothetical protein